MRMLHVIESFAPGGMETTFLHVLRQFKEFDSTIEHHVLSFARGALEPEYRDAADSVAVGCDQETLDRHVRAGYDLVYILFERCAYRLLPRLLAHSSATVVYGKGYDMGGMYRLNEGLLWQADASMLNACDAATFTTPNLAAGFPTPPGRTTVLRKAADVRRFAALPKPDKHTPKRIVCVANLHPRKRLGDLIAAMPRIRQEVPDAQLRLVGGGNLAEARRLSVLAQECDVDDCVELVGTKADVVPEIAAARVIALPSSCEGVPTALLEGMAAGRPVVATDVGHVSSIVTTRVEGFLFTPGDVETLAERLTWLLTDAALAERMGRAARKRAMEHDVRTVARTLLDALVAAAHGAAAAMVDGTSARIADGASRRLPPADDETGASERMPPPEPLSVSLDTHAA